MHKHEGSHSQLVRLGVECAEIDAAVHGHLKQAGFDDFRLRLHRCGHGFGLGNDEPPWIAEGSTHVLQTNMVISIEPGICETHIGGYRHSDTVLGRSRDIVGLPAHRVTSSL